MNGSIAISHRQLISLPTTGMADMRIQHSDRCYGKSWTIVNWQLRSGSLMTERNDFIGLQSPGSPPGPWI